MSMMVACNVDTETLNRLIDVVEDRAAAQYVAEQVSVPHQSPQVILLQEGRAVWHASHFELAGEALQEQVETCLSLLS